MPRTYELPAAAATPPAAALALLDHAGDAGAVKASSAAYWRWLWQSVWSTGTGAVGAPAPAGSIGERMLFAAGIRDLPAYTNAAAAAAGGLLPGDLYRTPPAGAAPGVLKSVPLNAVTAGVSPFQHGAVGDGTADDTAALVAAMTAVDAQVGSWLDLSGGTFRVTSALPTLQRPVIDGKGTGTVYVDWALSAPVLRLYPPAPANGVYTVAAIDRVTDYDWAGSFTGNSTVVRLTVTLGVGQSLPKAGAVAKLTSKKQLIGVDAGDSTGQHIVVLSTAGSYVFCATWLFDAYQPENPLNECQLILLSEEPAVAAGFRVKGRFDRVVSEDWRHSALEVIGCRYPNLQNILTEDMAQGVMLLGCFGAVTRGLRAHHMRSATASESPAVSGYGVVDSGSFGTIHMGLFGVDCRHVFTTVTATAVDWPKVAWGRSIMPVLMGGVAHGCASSAWDTHPDCVYPTFIGLEAHGGYFGEQSDGCAVQVRGGPARIIDCKGLYTHQGINIYKQLAGQSGDHIIDGFHYVGTGIGVRLDCDSGLSDTDKRQRVRMRRIEVETSAQNAMLFKFADIDVEGDVRVRAVGNTSGMALAYLESTVLHDAGGRLLHDIRGFSYDTTNNPSNPRVINFSGANSSTHGIVQLVVIAGDVTLLPQVRGWLAVLVENDNPAAIGHGPWRFEVHADRLPDAVSGGYSQFGVNNLLLAASFRPRFRVGGPAPKALVVTPLTIVAGHNGWHFYVTSATTVSVSAVGVLPPNFECWVHCVGVGVTLNGLTGGSNSLTSGQVGWISVLGDTSRVYKMS